MRSGEVRRCSRVVGCHVNAGRESGQSGRDGLGGYTLVTGEAWAEYRNRGGSTTDHRERKLDMRKRKKKIKHISTPHTNPSALSLAHDRQTSAPSLLPSSLKVKASKRKKKKR